MRFAIPVVLMLVGTNAFSQTTQTQCQPGYTKGSMNCTSTTTPPPQTQIQPPATFEHFVRGRELALQEQQLQMRQQRLPAASPAPTNADIATLQALATEKDKREKSAREAYWWQQMNACARVSKEEKAIAECRDRLLLSDPYFARANSEVQPPFPPIQKTQ